MAKDMMLVTPHEIETALHEAFKDYPVRIDPEHKLIDITILSSEVGSGVHVTITTAVSRLSLIDVIQKIALQKLSTDTGIAMLQTETALSGWDEATRPSFLPLCRPSTNLWVAGAWYITRVAAAVGSVVERTIASITDQRVQARTAIALLTTIPIVAAVFGSVIAEPARILSMALRAADLTVWTAHYANHTLDATRLPPEVDLTISVLAISLLFIAGPPAIIASGLLACIPVIIDHIPQEVHTGHSLAEIYKECAGDPKDPQIARDTFGVPAGETPQQDSVNTAYDVHMKLFQADLQKATSKKDKNLIQVAQDHIAFVNMAYSTLMGHSRYSSVD